MSRGDSNLAKICNAIVLDLNSSGTFYCDSSLPGMGMCPHRECTSSPGMRMCLTGNAILTRNGVCLTRNAHPRREWEYVSPGMHILTGNGDVPHRERTSSPGMHILTGNAHSLYRVYMYQQQRQLNDTVCKR